MPESPSSYDLLSVTALIVSSFVNNNTVRATDLPDLVSSVHVSLVQASDRSLPAKPSPVPAVPIKRSITLDYLVCLEDGKKLKTLKRYLQKAFGLSPDAYRAKWGLPPDYPMVAPGYSVRRAELAKASAFGNYRKRIKVPQSSLAEDPAPVLPQTSARRRGRSLRKAA